MTRTSPPCCRYGTSCSVQLGCHNLTSTPTLVLIRMCASIYLTVSSGHFANCGSASLLTSAPDDNADHMPRDWWAGGADLPGQASIPPGVILQLVDPHSAFNPSSRC